MSQRARIARQRRLARRGRMWVATSVLGVVLLAVVAVVVTSGGGGAGGGGASGSGTVRVSMTEFAFDPDPIVLTSGDARLDVVNDGAVAHDLVIGQLGKGTPDLPPGERMVLDLSDQPAGTYQVVCDLPGHTEAGMVTELTLQ